MSEGRRPKAGAFMAALLKKYGREDPDRSFKNYTSPDYCLCIWFYWGVFLKSIYWIEYLPKMVALGVGIKFKGVKWEISVVKWEES